MVYSVSKENLDTITASSLVSNMICIEPVRVIYLQMCAKVFLSKDSFIRSSSENNFPEVKVLGETVRINEVIFISDGEKIVMCADKFLELIDKTLCRNVDKEDKYSNKLCKDVDDENPVSISTTLTVQLVIIMYAPFLAFQMS